MLLCSVSLYGRLEASDHKVLPVSCETPSDITWLGESNFGSMPHLELVIRGVKRQQASSDSKPQLPIIPVILHRV